MSVEDPNQEKNPSGFFELEKVITIALIIQAHPGYHVVFMKRITINALVDIGCVITFIPSLITGLVLYLFLPSGGGRGGSWITWMGITRHDWVLIHDVTSFAFAALLILHILLHWKFFGHIGKMLKPDAKAPDDCVT